MNALESTPKEKAEEICWECLHCTKTSYTLGEKPPHFCDCGKRDFKLAGGELNNPDSHLFMRALFGVNKNEGRQAVTNYLLKKFNFKTIEGVKSNVIWIYQDGVYIRKGKRIIQEEVKRVLGELANITQTKEIAFAIAGETFIDLDKFRQTNPYLVCVKNGILDLRNATLTEHAPDKIFLNKFPVEYKPGADCPKIKEFLNTVLDDDKEAFEEYIGYLLLGEYRYKRAGLLLGDRDTGKTTLLNLLTAFVGETNVAGESLQKLVSNDHSAFNLVGKTANFYDDLSTNDFYDAGNFKVATGGGYLRAERKFEDAFQFKNTAKHLFATNEVPLPKQPADDAYYSRWLVWRFLNQFTEGEAGTNKTLGQELATAEELSGLLNLALKGFQRLEERQGFSYNKTPEEVRVIMHESGDVISAFASNCLEQNDGNLISKEDMFRVFRVWCKQEKRAPTSKEALGRRLPVLSEYLVSSPSRRKVNGIKQTCFVNADFNEQTKTNILNRLSNETINEIGNTTLNSYGKEKRVSSVSFFPNVEEKDKETIENTLISKKEHKEVKEVEVKQLVTVSSAKEVFSRLPAKKGVVKNADAKPYKEETQLLLNQGLLGYVEGGFRLINEKWGNVA